MLLSKSLLQEVIEQSRMPGDGEKKGLPEHLKTFSAEEGVPLREALQIQYLNPIRYYQKKAKGDTLTTFTEFFNTVSRILAIAGVFAALVIYLDRLEGLAMLSRILRITGGTILFGISLSVVIHHAFMCTARAANNRHFLYSVAYFISAIALGLVATGLMTNLARFPDLVIEVVSFVVFITTFPILIMTVIIPPIRIPKSWATTIGNLGPITQPLFKGGPYIGMTFLLITAVGPNQLTKGFDWFWNLFFPPEGVFIIHWFSLLFLLALSGIAVMVIAIISNKTARMLLWLWRSILSTLP